jgi:hypothetical protein
MTAKTIVHYIGIGLCIALFPLAAVSSGATFRTVYYMQSPYQQPGGLIEGSPGILYSQADGLVIFSLTIKGVITYLATIQDPPYILESVPVSAANGSFYAFYESVSNTGGSANVFSVGAGGGMQVYPAQSLAISFSQNLPDGTLLGTAYEFSVGSGWQCNFRLPVHSRRIRPLSFPTNLCN